MLLGQMLQECKPLKLRRPIVGRVFTPIYGANYGQSETNGAREKKQPPGCNHARSTRRYLIYSLDSVRWLHKSALSNG